jgi:hypothetical protein
MTAGAWGAAERGTGRLWARLTLHRRRDGITEWGCWAGRNWLFARWCTTGLSTTYAGAATDAADHFRTRHGGA